MSTTPPAANLGFASDVPSVGVRTSMRERPSTFELTRVGGRSLYGGSAGQGSIPPTHGGA